MGLGPVLKASRSGIKASSRQPPTSLNVSGYLPTVATERELEFVGTLGRGGFGTVYLANLHGRDRFVRRVAVKVLRHAGDIDADLVARQRDEARLLGLLSNEAIVQVLDLTEIAGRPAVVMEYVEGVDCNEVARCLRSRFVAFSPRAALEIVAATAGALDAAWSSLSPISGAPLHVIHRDIKPANVVLTPRGGVKVLDFGIARAEFNRDGVTGSGFFGTPAYMAPEFWIQEPIGPGYDVYALGVTLLELLSGQSPDRAPMEAERFAAWREARVNALGVTGGLRTLLVDMLAFEARHRPSAAFVQERAADLSGSVEGESLARLARALVPGLVDERERAMDKADLPSRTLLGVVSGPATGPAAPQVLAAAAPPSVPSLVVPPPPAVRETRGLPWLVAGSSMVAVAAAVTLGLGAAVWAFPGLWSGAQPVDPEPTAGQAPASPAPTASPGSDLPVEVAAVPVATPPAAAAGSNRDAPASTPGGGPVHAGPARTTASPVSRPSPAAVAGSAHDPAGTLGAETSVAAGPTPTPTSTASPAVAQPPQPVAPPSRSIAFGCSIVGAALSVDGAPAGRTPRAAVPLADGTHDIVAASGDHACRTTITVGPDQPVGYVCDLTSERWTARL